MLSPIARKSMAASTMEVTSGVVRITDENSATSKNEAFCSQIFRSTLGHLELPEPQLLFKNPLCSEPVLSEVEGCPSRLKFSGPRTLPRCSHSPGKGIGQIARQPRPKKGTAIRMRMPHQAIHMNTMLKL